MTDVKNVYFVPAGELYNIAIESLPDFENPSKRISDRWNFFRLSSTRELVFRKRPKSIESAAVYGGINYSTDATVIMNNSKQYATTRGGLGFDISNISDTTLLRSGAKYLPATKDEAANIALELKKKGIRYTMYTDSTATEASFKNLTGNNVNLLHIATHGFYCTPQEINKEIEFLFQNNNELQVYEDNALNRSGLLFAGANNTLSGKALSPDIDGILTAKEIGTMDLRNLDLVVLSACQTGLGDVTGEGVFGLQRAFKKAGVNSLLMSLWKVDDTATALFMTRFYKNMMTGMNKRNAFVDAQKYLREYEIEIEVVDTQVKAIDRVRNRHKAKNERTYKKVRPYNNPRFWAAFVLLDAIE
jgi:CHAT domain-containing protein